MEERRPKKTQANTSPTAKTRPERHAATGTGAQRSDGKGVLKRRTRPFTWLVSCLDLLHQDLLVEYLGQVKVNLWEYIGFM